MPRGIPEATPVQPVETPVPEVRKHPDYKAHYIPSNWDIKTTEVDGILHFMNNVTSYEFEGTMQEFNKLLKGV